VAVRRTRREREPVRRAGRAAPRGRPGAALRAASAEPQVGAPTAAPHRIDHALTVTCGEFANDPAGHR